MSEMTQVWVKAVAPTDMSEFGIRFKTEDRPPTYLVDDGQVWRSACWVVMYDDGRIVVWAAHHLTNRELETVYGLAERTFNGGSRMCRYEKWERLRKTAKRKQGYWRMHYYVRADGGDAQKVADAALMCQPETELRRQDALGIERQLAADEAVA